MEKHRAATKLLQQTRFGAGLFFNYQGCHLPPILRFLLRFSTRLPPPPISAVLLRFPRPEENVLFTACFHCQRRIFAAERPIAKPIRALVTPAAQKGNGDWLAGHSRLINNNGGRNREPLSGKVCSLYDQTLYKNHCHNQKFRADEYLKYDPDMH